MKIVFGLTALLLLSILAVGEEVHIAVHYDLIGAPDGFGYLGHNSYGGRAVYWTEESNGSGVYVQLVRVYDATAGKYTWLLYHKYEGTFEFKNNSGKWEPYYAQAIGWEPSMEIPYFGSNCGRFNWT